MKLEELISQKASEAVKALYEADVPAGDIQLQQTNENFEGHITVVAFALSRAAKKAPPVIAEELGGWLQENVDEVVGYNVVKGFLNLVVSDAFWLSELAAIHADERFGYSSPSGEVKMVEYSSPNTNKPLHLGHLRNNFLGWSVAEILKANGHDVAKVQIINDRGIHICMSMLAWQRWGDGETPESSGLKGDKLVGKYYVRFNSEYMAQTQVILDAWEQGDFGDAPAEMVEKYHKLKEVLNDPEKSDKDKASAKDAIKDLAKSRTAIIAEAREMLLKWEAKDPEVVELWKTMNGWVYSGFDQTYNAMGVEFDKLYYESDTYLVGKEEVLKGLEEGTFYQKEDGSVWVDLSDVGMDQKLLLRADGTAVYMTQDIGTAILRFKDYEGLNQQIYTVGNEQEYHFQVLFHTLEKLGWEMARNNYHLSYGMVELPHGRMKSREGTVVDADELIAEVIKTAKEKTLESGKVDKIPEEERPELFRKIGLGALKYYLLKVDPKKGMMFNPEESVSLEGNTGPFIQYAYARTRSVLERYGKTPQAQHDVPMNKEEQELIILLNKFPEVVAEAGVHFSPSILAHYVYDVAKHLGSFYHVSSVIKAETPELADFRACICENTCKVLKHGLALLGIEVPERM